MKYLVLFRDFGGKKLFNFHSRIRGKKNCLGEQLGLRLTSMPNGDVVFTQAGLAKAQRSLLYGQNIRKVRRSQYAAQRFSEYIFRTQRSGTATTEIAGDGAAKVAASVPDAGVLRHRPLRVQAKR